MGSAQPHAGSSRPTRSAKQRMGSRRKRGAVRRRGIPSLLLDVGVVVAFRRLELLRREEAVAVGIEPGEVLEETRRVRLRFGLADLAVTVGVELLPVLRALRLVEGAQLFAGHLPVAVG